MVDQSSALAHSQLRSTRVSPWAAHQSVLHRPGLAWHVQGLSHSDTQCQWQSAALTRSCKYYIAGTTAASAARWSTTVSGPAALAKLQYSDSAVCYVILSRRATCWQLAVAVRRVCATQKSKLFFCTHVLQRRLAQGLLHIIRAPQAPPSAWRVQRLRPLVRLVRGVLSVP